MSIAASAGKAKAGMVHSVSGCTRGVQVKLWDTWYVPYLSALEVTRRYTNLRLRLRLPLQSVIVTYGD